MAAGVTGAQDFAALSLRLKEAGQTGLRRELYKAISDAAKPLAREISSLEHLRPYLPDRYAAVLAADFRVTTSKLTGRDPGVRLIGVAPTKARAGRRKVTLLDKGLINHPVYAQGERKTWRWSNAQTGGMKPGFFGDVVKNAAPEVREKILAAMTETARKITGG